jgi:hypothetical protein
MMRRIVVLVVLAACSKQSHRGREPAPAGTSAQADAARPSGAHDAAPEQVVDAGSELDAAHAETPREREIRKAMLQPIGPCPGCGTPGPLDPKPGEPDLRDALKPGQPADLGGHPAGPQTIGIHKPK